MKKNYNKIPTENLTFTNGIWFSKKSSEISYPREGYNKNLQIEENSFWFKHRNDVIIETLKNFPPFGVFYDIGGGNGFVSVKLQNNGIETILVEPGKSGAYNAKERGIKNIICSKIEEIGFEQNFIPAMGLFDVIEHIREDQKYLTKLFSLLKKGGRLYLTVPAYNFLWSTQDKNSGHFRRYTIRKLRTLLEKSGFKVEYKTYFFSILPIPVLLFRTLPSKLKLQKDPENLKYIKREHTNKTGILGNMLQKIWKFELRLIMNKKKILFGGSSLIVAQKT